VAQRVGRGVALLFHDRGTRSGRMVSSTSRPHFIREKDPVPILQEAGWAPGPVWTGGKSRTHRDSIPDRPGCSQLLYRLSYRARFYKYEHEIVMKHILIYRDYTRIRKSISVFKFKIITPQSTCVNRHYFLNFKLWT